MNYGGYFDFENKNQRIAELESIMQQEGFWDDKRKSETVISELNGLKKIIDRTLEVKNKVSSNKEIIETLTEEDEEFLNLLIDEIPVIKEELNSLEIELLLNDPYDKLGAILEIHSGAGGTEACDWADMLFRMYNRWCDKKNYKVDEARDPFARGKTIPETIDYYQKKYMKRKGDKHE